MYIADIDKKARNKRINEITSELKELFKSVEKITGWSEMSLNAKIGGKNMIYLNVRQDVIYSHEQYMSLWLEGLMNYLDELNNKYSSNSYEFLILMKENSCIYKYVELFLERYYLKKYEELSKRKPSGEQAIIWIGQDNASYGILVSPRFKNGQWENDGSEIRKFKPMYYTIEHILETGLVIPFKEERITFNSVEDYLNFFKNVIVRNSGSTHEMKIAELYNKYVMEQKNPLKVPLLIPEYRYKGIDKKHKYRLDFTVINPYTLQKHGFELSPWSTHGYISRIKDKTQKEVNEEAKGNFEREMEKVKDYYKQHNVFCLIYTDKDLEDISSVFENIKEFLNPQKENKSIMVHTAERFKNYK